MHLRNKSKVVSSLARRKRFSPLMLVGLSVPVVLALIASAVLILPHLGSRADAINGDCTLIVPSHPLSAQGLATPYQLVATDPANGLCKESNKAQAAFVQGAVINLATGQISIYDPLVIDQGTQPAVAPVVPKLPANAIVALWFGSNGNTLTLQDTNGSLRQGRCVNGVRDSIFGQFSYCNAPAFFEAANQAIQAGKLVPPSLGTGQDGLPCPTTRDFSIVDQDQSDNVTTTYRITDSGQVAQNNQANAALGGQVQKNGSDERLLTLVDSALGCTPWMAPDLADPQQMLPALPLGELQAAAQQASTVALVPESDPMVLINNNQPDLHKLNAYRRGVDQTRVPTLAAASTTTYCKQLFALGPARIQLDMQFTQLLGSPDSTVANSLFTFLAQRFVATYGADGLNCADLLNVPDPIAVTTDGSGVAVSATFNAGNTNTQNQNTNPASATNTTPTVGSSTTPTVPATNPTALPTSTTGTTSTPIQATPSPTANPATGATPTPIVPAASPTATPTAGAGG